MPTTASSSASAAKLPNKAAFNRREGEHGHGGEAGILQQLAKGEFEVVRGFAILDLRFAIEGENLALNSQNKGGFMTEAELKQRTKQFALRLIKLVNALPKNTAGRALGSQLVRSRTERAVA